MRIQIQSRISGYYKVAFKTEEIEVTEYHLEPNGWHLKFTTPSGQKGGREIKFGSAIRVLPVRVIPRVW